MTGLTTPPETLRKVAAAALDRPDLDEADLASVDIRQAAHRVDNMTTAELLHVRGALVDGTDWEAFAKVLHPASASPLMAYIPADHHESVLRNLNWLDEPAIYRSALSTDLPDGLRMPRLLAVEELADRVVLWLEQIEPRTSWSIPDYQLAARSLGAMAGRWPERRVTEELGVQRRDLAYLFFGKLANVDLPILATDEHWSDPHVARVAGPGFRAELEALIERAPMRIAAAEGLPHAMSHGDATPDNLLRTAEGICAIDWSYGSSGPLGADLGQLLAGRFDTGQADPELVPEVASVLLDAYLQGLADEGVHPEPHDVLTGWATHLAIRSVISSTVIDHRPDLDGDERVELLERRVAVARIGLDLEARL
jgi:hypothetical protein